MGWKACENLTGVGTKLYVKCEAHVCRTVNVMPGHTDRQTDRQTDKRTLHLYIRFRLHTTGKRQLPPLGRQYTIAQLHGDSQDAGIAGWSERRTRDRKVSSSNSGGAAGEFYSPESPFCADS